MNGKLKPFKKVEHKAPYVVGISVQEGTPSQPLVDRVRDQYVNGEYIVFIDRNYPSKLHGVWELSVFRVDGKPANDWRDLQAIKTMLVGAEYEAVELFPAESRVIDTANETHLFVLTHNGEPVTIQVGRHGERIVNSLMQNGQRPL